jgi:hypothetical protein
MKGLPQSSPFVFGPHRAKSNFFSAAVRLTLIFFRVLVYSTGLVLSRNAG